MPTSLHPTTSQSSCSSQRSMILNRRTRAGFFREIDAAFSNLMVLHGGRRVPYEGEELPQAFDYVAVTVEFAEIWFRFIRGRGELRTQVARPNEPYNWEELTLLWNLWLRRNAGLLHQPFANLV